MARSALPSLVLFKDVRVCLFIRQLFVGHVKLSPPRTERSRDYCIRQIKVSGFH
jgi:hypothetical protein